MFGLSSCPAGLPYPASPWWNAPLGQAVGPVCQQHTSSSTRRIRRHNGKEYHPGDSNGIPSWSTSSPGHSSCRTWRTGSRDGIKMGSGSSISCTSWPGTCIQIAIANNNSSSTQSSAESTSPAAAPEGLGAATPPPEAATATQLG